MKLHKFITKISLPGWALIGLGTIAWSLTMIKSGRVYSYGMGFWGPNGHDGVWHIALIKSLANRPWEMPIFAGEAIRNYHVGFDLVVAILHKITFIPVETLYFQIIPPLLALGIGLSVYLFVFKWKKSQVQAFWATFFVYFGGSWGWLVSVLRNGGIGGESLFWSQQAISTLINPPFALSLLIIFTALSLLLMGLRHEKKTVLFLASVLFGILVQIKVYAGILCLFALFVAGMWRLFKRKGMSVLKVFTGALIVSIIVFSPISGDVESALVWKPFWFLENMMAFPDRFYWPRFAEAMVNYKLAGNLPKGFVAYFVAFLVFWFGNLGTRAIKEVLVLRWLRRPRALNYLEVFFVVVVVAGAAIPMFFVQTGTAWNTIQFMYYSLVFSGILAGIVLGEWLERQKKLSTYVVSGAVILLTLPTTVGTLGQYLPNRPPAKISKKELEALHFLSQQPDGVVLSLPLFDKTAADAAVDNPPRPLYLYESTAYVSAVSGKKTFMEDEVNLEITGYDWKSRRDEIEKAISLGDTDELNAFTKRRGIAYVYIIKGSESFLFEDIQRIFENEEVEIYQVPAN